MDYQNIKEIIGLLEEFEARHTEGDSYPDDISGFKKWIYDTEKSKCGTILDEPYWEGKENGRSAESTISTLLVHLNRYAKTYSKSVISDSEFTTQEDFIYLINLKAFGAMTKMQLIKKNIHNKPVGMLIIARLLKQDWITQEESETDKRNRIVRISEKGMDVLDRHMKKIREATDIITGDLSCSEKMELIRILNKMDRFHHAIFSRNIENKELIKTVYEEYSFKNQTK